MKQFVIQVLQGAALNHLNACEADRQEAFQVGEYLGFGTYAGEQAADDVLEASNFWAEAEEARWLEKHGFGNVCTCESQADWVNCPEEHGSRFFR